MNYKPERKRFLETPLGVFLALIVLGLWFAGGLVAFTVAMMRPEPEPRPCHFCFVERTGASSVEEIMDKVRTNQMGDSH